MAKRFLQSIGVAVVLVALALVLEPGTVRCRGPGASASGVRAATKRPARRRRTPWGAPDLQGIWNDTYEIPLQRPARYGNKEFFTDEERAELDKQRGGHREPGRPALRARQRAGRGRGLRHEHLPVAQADGQAHVAHRRSAGRPHSAADPGGDQAQGGACASSSSPCFRPPTSARTSCPAAKVATYGPPSPRRGRDAAVLCRRRRRRGGRHQSCRRSGRSDARRAVHGGHPAGLRRRRRLLPADRPVAAGGLDLLRHGPGPGMAAGDPDHGSAAPACRTSANGGATREADGKATRWSST